MLLEGIFIPLTTPFHPDGRLFPRKLEYNVERYSRTPASGMFVLGDTSEADGLTDEEARTVLTTAIAAAADPKVMIASVGRESVYATLEMAEFAASAGYDAIALRPPSFAGDAGMRIETAMFMNAVLDGAPLPVVLASAANCIVSREVFTEIADHPALIGRVAADIGEVESTKLLARNIARDVTVTHVFAAATRRMLNAAYAASTSSLGGVAVLEARPALKTRSKRVGFQIVAGTTSEMLASWQAGASAAIPRAGAIAPQACCEVWQAFRDGDLPLAEEKQERLRAIAKLVEGPRGIAVLKHGCDFNGYFGGLPRLPLLPLTASESFNLQSELTGMRN